MIRPLHAACAAFILGAAGVASQPAFAVTMKECSAMYRSAQRAGTLNGMAWKDFRKTKCGGTAAAAPAEKAPAAAEKAAATEPSAARVGSASHAVFPRAISSKYAKEKPGTARRHTCLDQYHENERAGGAANGGLKWIQKGDGYYSECNKRLKG